MRFWSIDGTKDSVLMEMNGFNIMLIIKSVVQDVMILVIDLVTHLVLIGRVAAFVVLIDAMSVLIRSHITVI